VRAVRSWSIVVACVLLAGCGSAQPAPTVKPLTLSARKPVVYEATLQPTRSTGRLELRFKQAARRLLSTVDEIATLRVTLSGANSLVQEFDGTMLAAGLAGAQGALALNALTPGPVTVSVEARRADGQPIGSAEVDVNITAGQTTVAALTLTLEDTYVENPNGALETDVTIQNGATIINPIAPAAAREGFSLIKQAPTVLLEGFEWLGGLDVVGEKLYISDHHNGLIRSVNVQDGAWETLATEQFQGWSHFMAASGSNVYFSDGNNRIRVLDTANGNTVTTLLEGVTVTGLTVVGNKLYFADFEGWTHSGAIKSLDLTDGVTVETVIPAGLLNSPQGLATDGTSVYIADQGNNAIKCFDTREGLNPALTTVLSTGLMYPSHVAVAGGKLYVADFNAPSSIFWASTAPDSPLSTLPTGLTHTHGLAAGPDGRVYVTGCLGAGLISKVVRLPAVE